MLSRTAAWIHVIFILFILIYGTYNLFLGQFERSLSTFPVLAVYYIFIIAPQKRAEKKAESSTEDQE